MKISKFANAANVTNSECFVFRYLQHTLDTSQFVQVFQNTWGFDLFCIGAQVNFSTTPTPRATQQVSTDCGRVSGNLKQQHNTEQN